MRPYSRGVPILVGLLLLVAAVLKADGFLLEEKLHDGVLGSRVFLVTVIAGEFFLAAWLLSGMAAVRCREATMGLFGLFALVKDLISDVPMTSDQSKTPDPSSSSPMPYRHRLMSAKTRATLTRHPDRISEHEFVRSPCGRDHLCLAA